MYECDVYIVGKFLKSQLSPEQLKVFMNEENNRRKNLLHKYIKLSTDAKVYIYIHQIE